jgi:gentisate 1,2-dioxygenase
MSKAKLVIEEKDRPLERNRMGLYRWYIHPAFTDVVCRHILFWTQDIPPGSRSGQQKHQGGRIHYIVEGKGYSLLNGVRYDWEEEDLLIVPIERGGTIIQHFNADPDRPAKMAVAEPNWYDILGVDMACGLEQLENSPDYP